jgi:hypothetical protein
MSINPHNCHREYNRKAIKDMSFSFYQMRNVLLKKKAAALEYKTKMEERIQRKGTQESTKIHL